MRALPISAAKWAPLGLVALTLLCKLPTLATPAYWDEIAWLEQAHALSQRGLLTALPGLHPPAAFWGHPPGLHLSAAAIWKVVGYSLASAHLLIAGFAATGVVATYLVGRFVRDAWTGGLAALLLLFSPLYLAQSGMFLADVPITALGTLAVYLGLRGRTAGYLAAASAMVLIKETSIAFLLAFLAYLLLVDGPGSRAAWRRVLVYSAPLGLIGLFFVAQKIATGHFVFIYEFDVALFELDAAIVKSQVRSITRWIFVEQGRWLVSLLIAAALIVRREARRDRLLLLFALAVGLFGYAFSVLLYLPRYLLPVLPLFYLLGAASVMALFRRRSLQVAAAILWLGLGAASMRSHPMHRNGEFDLGYLDVVRVNREISEHLEERFPDATILAAWPQSRQLSQPRLGYVARRHDVVQFERVPAPATPAALIVVSSPWTGPQAELRAHAQSEAWRLIHRASRGEAVAELFALADTAAVEDP